MSSFFWRRMHSLTGIFLVLFLLEHLLTNSQAALWIGDDGRGFVHAVNWIYNLPYLLLIELTLIGAPLLIHLVWGIKYLRTAAPNSFKSDGTKPALPEYRRNHAYTWQRITSWILVFAVIAHVFHMRIWNYPASATVGDQKEWMVKVTPDPGIYTLAERLGMQIYDKSQIETEQEELQKEINAFEKIKDAGTSERELALLKQRVDQKRHWMDAVKERTIDENQAIATVTNFGTAELILVREVFKMPLMMFLYTIFVLSAVYHACNGLWTSLITWGVSLTQKSQRVMKGITTFLMLLLAFFGLAAIYGTFWFNLRS
ncbi:MAG: succinate dehydrogenase [Waddliaceae bacterium]